MPNVNTASIEELEGLGLSPDDARQVVRSRETSAIESMSDVAALDISRQGRTRLVSLVETADLALGEPERFGFWLEINFKPKLSDLKVVVTISYVDAAGADRTHEVERSASDRIIFEREGVNLSKTLTLKIRTQAGQSLFQKDYSPSELAAERDGPKAYITREIDLLPFVLPTIRRFRRSGRFLVPSRPEQRFDGYHLTAAPVGADGVAQVRELLGSETLSTAAVKLDPGSEDAARRLSSLALSPAGFDFAGAFSIDRPAPTLEEPSGWAWFLAGPAFFLASRPTPIWTRRAATSSSSCRPSTSQAPRRTACRWTRTSSRSSTDRSSSPTIPGSSAGRSTIPGAFSANSSSRPFCG